jgi:hypothetical protein
MMQVRHGAYEESDKTSREIVAAALRKKLQELRYFTTCKSPQECESRGRFIFSFPLPNLDQGCSHCHDAPHRIRDYFHRHLKLRSIDTTAVAGRPRVRKLRRLRPPPPPLLKGRRTPPRRRPRLSPDPERTCMATWISTSKPQPPCRTHPRQRSVAAAGGREEKEVAAEMSPERLTGARTTRRALKSPRWCASSAAAAAAACTNAPPPKKTKTHTAFAGRARLGRAKCPGWRAGVCVWGGIRRT